MCLILSSFSFSLVFSIVWPRALHLSTSMMCMFVYILKEVETIGRLRPETEITDNRLMNTTIYGYL